MAIVHVCMVSEQTIPNLIPIRMSEFRPDLVFLLTTPAMKSQADRLEDVITSDGIQVKRLSVKPYDYISMHKVCEEIVSTSADILILNATGGTKIMALAAMDVFRSKGLTVLYVDTKNKTIHQLSPEFKPFKFKNVLDVTTYLKVYGQNVIKSESTTLSNRFKILIYTLLKEAEMFKKAISDFNRVASRAAKSDRFPCVVKDIESLTATSAHKKLLKLYEEYGLLKHHKRDIKINKKEYAEFMAGGWLEDYVFDVVKSLNPPDVLKNVKVEWDKKGARPPTNEYDVVFIWDNRLFLVECKTKRFMGKDIESNSSEPIYKLDSLKDSAGGLFGQGIFISYKGLTTEMKERLEAYGLKYCEKEDIINLREKLLEWINT